ncbi:hypothetical protein HPB49_005494 [Dermacentor silvarum]|uniref:Uncharacterized protein n=1 Tax=Dermacentor silvarum TaxID=543639 RepID=A0ACB8CVL1_DERSI|nr:hypothetical protein HPB49_005494 [Dermacentor silvarum]
MGRHLRSFTASFKLQVTEYAEEHGKREAGRKYDVHEKRVRYWIKQKDALTATNRSRKAFRGKKCKYPKLEGELVKYVIDTRNDGYAVSTDMVRVKALNIARHMEIPKAQFKASRGEREQPALNGKPAAALQRPVASPPDLCACQGSVTGPTGARREDPKPTGPQHPGRGDVDFSDGVDSPAAYVSDRPWRRQERARTGTPRSGCSGCSKAGQSGTSTGGRGAPACRGRRVRGCAAVGPCGST